MNSAPKHKLGVLRRNARMRALLATTLGIVMVAVLGPMAPSALAAPPSPSFTVSPEGYAGLDPQDTCDPTAKPGVVDFRSMVLAAYPSTGDSGITRACDIGGTSEHKEGRAWDWRVSASSQAGTAGDLLNWLLATRDGHAHAYARRLGIMYIIWNRQIWRAYRASEGWQPYSGDNPHTDHVHFSFSWAGARKQTTWWTAGRRGGSADVNGDGLADIMAVYNDGNLTWYQNSGSYTFSAPRDIGDAPGFKMFDLGDVDRNGRADIVAVYNSNELVWYPNNGTPHYLSARNLGNAPGFRLMAMGDVDGNGYDDIVAVYTSGELMWYANSGSNTFSAARSLGNAPGFKMFEMGDVDGNGYDDIVAVYNSGELMWYANSGSNTFSAARSLGNAPGFKMFGLADLGTDGHADIVAVYNSGELMWYQNSGNNTFSAARSLGNAPGFRLMDV